MTEDERIKEEFEFEELMRDEGLVQPARAQTAADIIREDAKDMGFGEVAMISAGREFNKLGAGAMDIYDSIRQRMADPEDKQKWIDSQAERKREQDQYDSYFEPLEEEHFGATLTGAVLPYMATLPAGLMASGVRGGSAAIARTTGKAVPKMLQKEVVKDVSHLAPKSGMMHSAGNLGKAIGKEGAIGATEGALHYNDTAAAGAAFGAGGAAGGKLLGNVFGGNMNKLSVEDQRIIDWAKKNNLYVPPGMRTGDTALQQMDGAMATHRLTADKVNDALRDSKRMENRLVTKELADAYDEVEVADILSNTWMDETTDAVRRRLDNLAENTMGELDSDLAYKASSIVENYRHLDPDQIAPKILKDWEQRIYALADGKVLFDGHQYQQWTQEIKKAASNQLNNPNGNRELGLALRRMASIFDDGIEKGLDGAKKSDWQKARRHYALLGEMDSLKDKTRIKGVNESGHVDYQKLAKKFSASDEVNKLAEVTRLRRHQHASSLGTSAMLGRALVPYKPAESLGAMMLLGSRLPKGLPVLPDMLAGAYMAGYPHATGALPFLGKHTTKALELGVPRSLLTGEFGTPEHERE